jgi:hypothetical protein
MTRILLCGLLAGVAICASFKLESSTQASAETVTYVCVPYRPGAFGQHQVFAVVINYSDNTAKNIFSTNTVWLPAKIMDRTIEWTASIQWPGGHTTKDYWAMDRYSGLLTRVNAGTAHCAKSEIAYAPPVNSEPIPSAVSPPERKAHAARAAGPAVVRKGTPARSRKRAKLPIPVPKPAPRPSLAAAPALVASPLQPSPLSRAAKRSSAASASDVAETPAAPEDAAKP